MSECAGYSASDKHTACARQQMRLAAPRGPKQSSAPEESALVADQLYDHLSTENDCKQIFQYDVDLVVGITSPECTQQV